MANVLAAIAAQIHQAERHSPASRSYVRDLSVLQRRIRYLHVGAACCQHCPRSVNPMAGDNGPSSSKAFFIDHDRFLFNRSNARYHKACESHMLFVQQPRRSLEGPPMPQAIVLTPSQLENPDLGQPHRWEFFDRHYLAEGDSWFTLAALPGGNLLQELHLQRSSLVINTASPGDTLSHIVEWRQNRPFVKLLSERKFAQKWDGVLLSAGGNDLIDAAISRDGILRRPSPTATTAGECIHDENLELLKRHLSFHLEQIIELRDARKSPNQGIPVFLHTYDYPTARPAPAKLVGVVGVSGPWLHRAYTEHHIPDALWSPLTEHLIDWLARLLQELKLPNVTVIDTRGTLERAAAGTTGDSGDWLNEIHANQGGRKKLAKRWAQDLHRIVG